MGYTIDYSDLTGKAKQDAALKHCLEYLGKERFDKVVVLLKDALADKSTSDDSLVQCLGMLGVSGYPARAMVAYGHELI